MVMNQILFSIVNGSFKRINSMSLLGASRATALLNRNNFFATSSSSSTPTPMPQSDGKSAKGKSEKHLSSFQKFVLVATGKYGYKNLPNEIPMSTWIGAKDRLRVMTMIFLVIFFLVLFTGKIRSLNSEWNYSRYNRDPGDQVNSPRERA